MKRKFNYTCIFFFIIHTYFKFNVRNIYSVCLKIFKTFKTDNFLFLVYKYDFVNYIRKKKKYVK